MATPEEVEQALTALRAARALLFEASQDRMNAVLHQARTNARVLELTEHIAEVRLQVEAAKAHVREVLEIP